MDISFYGELRESNYEYFLCDAVDIEKLVIAQRERFELPHYPFSKAEFLEAGAPGYYERIPELDALLELLDYYYDIPEKKLDEIVQNLNTHMRRSLEPEAALKYLESLLEIPAPEVLEALTARAVKRPSAEAYEKYLRETPVEKVKIGRNDPCPCGSGKKYKKCCGN